MDDPLERAGAGVDDPVERPAVAAVELLVEPFADPDRALPVDFLPGVGRASLLADAVVAVVGVPASPDAAGSGTASGLGTSGTPDTSGSAGTAVGAVVGATGLTAAS